MFVSLCGHTAYSSALKGPKPLSIRRTPSHPPGVNQGIILLPHQVGGGESPHLHTYISYSVTSRASQPRMLWRAGPIEQHWPGQDRIKFIKQNGVTHVNPDFESAMTLWFKKETI